MGTWTTLPTIPATTSQKWSPPVKRVQHQQLLPPKICGRKRPLRQLRSRNRVQGVGRPGTRRESKIQHQSQNLNQNLKKRKRKKRNPHQRLHQHQHQHQHQHRNRNQKRKNQRRNLRRRSPTRNRRTLFSSEESNGVER